MSQLAAMAEVATKKSLNVVSSNNKSNDVCSVLSNKSLIDVDNNKSTLNNRLTSLCDEDEEEDERNGLSISEELILDTGSDDKSLSELIENELALRICASKLESTVEPDIADETAAFIASEVIQYTIAEEHYYQNGVTESVSDLDQVDSNLNQAWSPDLSSPSSPSHEVLPDDPDKPNLKEQDEESGETVIVCSNKQDLSESIDYPEEFEEEPNEEEDVCTMSSKEAERVDLDEKDVSSPCDEELVMTCNAGEVNEVKDDSEDKEEEQMSVDHSLNDDVSALIRPKQGRKVNENVRFFCSLASANSPVCYLLLIVFDFVFYSCFLGLLFVFCCLLFLLFLVCLMFLIEKMESYAA